MCQHKSIALAALNSPADASLAPSARHHRGVARHAAALREDALGRVHPADVLGGRLCPDEDRGAALRLEGLGLLRREDNLADGRARRGRKTLADDAVLVRALVGELRATAMSDTLRVTNAAVSARAKEAEADLGVKELVEMAGFHHVDGLVLGDEALLEHVDGDADGGGAGALAVAALEHEELLVLDRELDVLHVLVVRLEPLHVREQVLVRLGHVRLQQAASQTHQPRQLLFFFLRAFAQDLVNIFSSEREQARDVVACGVC
eukprot:596505-Rhodomonas_salina.5